MFIKHLQEPWSGNHVNYGQKTRHNLPRPLLAPRCLWLSITTCPSWFLFPFLLTSELGTSFLKMDLRIKSPIFLIGSFWIQKTFLICNSDFLSFGLSKHWVKDFGCVTECLLFPGPWPRGSTCTCTEQACGYTHVPLGWFLSILQSSDWSFFCEVFSDPLKHSSSSPSGYPTVLHTCSVTVSVMSLGWFWIGGLCL